MKRIAALVLSIILLTGCGSPTASTAASDRETRTVFAMDTVMTLTVYGTEITRTTALDAAESEIGRLDDLLSISSESGDISRLNRDKEAAVSGETAELLRQAIEVSEETDGCFDPTVYPLVELWGFPSEQYRVPTPEEIAALLPHVGAASHVEISQAGDDSCTVTLAPGTSLDLGGIAKGYTSSRVLAVMAESGADSAIISLGGNVGTLGRKPDGSPWTVAIEDPEKSGEYAAKLTLDGGLFAITSGAYERYFEQDGQIYHHILDPKTGYPADSDLRSVTIISDDGTLADGLSTALFVMGFDGAVDFWRQHSEAFQMVLITADGLYATPELVISSDRDVQTLEGLH